MDRAAAFCDAVPAPVELARRMTFPEGACYCPHARARLPRVVSSAKLWTLPPTDGKATTPGNGWHCAFLTPDRAAVDAFHAVLAPGGTCEGPPRLRPHYHLTCYAAYVRS